MRTVSASARRRAALGYHWRAGWPFLVAGAGVAAFFLTLFIGAPLYVARDTRAAAARREKGVVTGVAMTAVTRGSPSPSGLVTARLAGGRTVYYSTYAAVRVGEAVQVQYRVGRSGGVYVESAGPVGR